MVVPSTLTKDPSSITTRQEGNTTITEGSYKEAVTKKETTTATTIETTDEKVRDEIIKQVEEEKKDLQDKGESNKTAEVTEEKTTYDLLDKDGKLVGDVTNYVGELKLIDGQQFEIETKDGKTSIKYKDKDGNTQEIEKTDKEELYNAILNAAIKSDVAMKYTITGGDGTEETLTDLSAEQAGKLLGVDRFTVVIDKKGTKTVEGLDASGNVVMTDDELSAAGVKEKVVAVAKLTDSKVNCQLVYNDNSYTISSNLADAFTSGQEFCVDFNAADLTTKYFYYDGTNKVYITQESNAELFSAISSMIQDASISPSYYINGTNIVIDSETAKLINNMDNMTFAVVKDQLGAYTVKYKSKGDNNADWTVLDKTKETEKLWESFKNAFDNSDSGHQTIGTAGVLIKEGKTELL